MAHLEHTNWKGTTGGTPWMQRCLIVWLRHFSLRSLYVVMALVIPWYILFNAEHRRAIWRYFHLHQGYPPLKAARYTVRDYYRFGQVILDRFAVYAGVKFDFVQDGIEEFRACCDAKQGVLLLCSHIGNLEISGYSFSAGDHRVNSVVFAGETKTVQENRAKSFSGNNIRMIPVREDMSHIFAVNSALADGEIVTIHADRLFGSGQGLQADFLGAPALFPRGPFTLAVQRDVPSFAMFALKTGYKSYMVIFKRLQMPSAEGMSSKERERVLLGEYVSALEGVLKEYPEQWFNFFEFWKMQGA